MPDVKIELKSRLITSFKSEKLVKTLSKILAKELTCPENELTADDFSIKIYFPDQASQMPDVDISVVAHDYHSRVKKGSDTIAKNIKEAFLKKIKDMGEVKVSLYLRDYGYSF